MVHHTYLEHLRCLYVRLELGTAARLQSGWLRVLRGRLPLCERRGGPDGGTPIAGCFTEDPTITWMIWGYPPFRKPLKLWLNPNKNLGKNGEHMGLNWTNLTNYNWKLQDREWWFSAEKWDLRRNKCIQMGYYKEHGILRRDSTVENWDHEIWLDQADQGCTSPKWFPVVSIFVA